MREPRTRDLLGDCTRDARISDCGKFRYSLTRRWAGGRTLLYVMLNPSTADHEVDDATIKRCTGFAQANGFGSLVVVNLFAYRATQPSELARMGWQVGPENDVEITAAAHDSDAVCVAWGSVGKDNAAERRVQKVMPLLRQFHPEPQCLRITPSGFPQHPLYLPRTCRLQPYSLDAIQKAMNG